MENIVNKLISCKKIITKNPRKEMYEDKQSSVILRNDFECTSEDRMYVFSVFMRKSKDMESLFSIGLKVEANFSSNGSRTPIGITILRCSGSHEHTNRIKTMTHLMTFMCIYLKTNNTSKVKINQLMRKQQEHITTSTLHCIIFLNVVIYLVMSSFF